MNRSSEQAEKKKPYQAPKLLVYGKLTDMTKTKGKTGKPDGGRHGLNRYTGN